MILVTGATGHLGNVLVRELLKENESVRTLVLPNESLQSLQNLPVEIIYGNTLDRDSLQKAMRGIDTVFHLAGIIAIRPGMENLMHRVNVEGTRNVGEIALENKVNKFIHVSSVHAFRREPHGTVIDENTPLALDSAPGSYDRTKAEGTLTILNLAQKGLNAVIVCPTGIIGRHDYLQSEMGDTLRSFSNKNLDILIEGAYDFVDVRDVAYGMLQACNSGVSGEVYILSGSQVTIENLHSMTQKVTGSRSVKLIIPVKIAIFAVSFVQHFFQWFKIKSRYTHYSLQTLIDNSTFSSQKACRELGYRPRPLNDTVADFLDWNKTHNAVLLEKLKDTRKLRLKKRSRVKTSG